jgi:hypothetical protein
MGLFRMIHSVISPSPRGSKVEFKLEGEVKQPQESSHVCPRSSMADVIPPGATALPVEKASATDKFNISIPEGVDIKSRHRRHWQKTAMSLQQILNQTDKPSSVKIKEISDVLFALQFYDHYKPWRDSFLEAVNLPIQNVLKAHFAGKQATMDDVMAATRILQDLNVAPEESIIKPLVEKRLIRELKGRIYNVRMWQKWNRDTTVKGLVSAWGMEDSYKKEMMLLYKILNLPHEPLSRKMVQRLFPKGVDGIKIKQQSVGNCYFLSALDSLAHHPAYPKSKILNMIEALPDGYFRVRFPGHPNHPILVHSPEMNAQWVSTSVLHEGKAYMAGTLLEQAKADMGVNILERAYGRLRKEVQHDVNSLSSSDTLVLVAAGWGENVLKELTGERAKFVGDGVRALYNQYQEVALKNQLNQFAQHQNEYVLAAGTLPGNGDDRSFLDPEKKINARHAYSIRSIDPDHETITLANPHDNSKLLVLGYEAFSKYFTRIGFVRLSA